MRALLRTGLQAAVLMKPDLHLNSGEEGIKTGQRTRKFYAPVSS
jgi:hypothetical protein